MQITVDIRFYTLSSFRAFRVVIYADVRCILPSETVVASRANICSPAPGSLSFGTQTPRCRVRSFTFAAGGRQTKERKDGLYSLVSTSSNSEDGARAPQHYCLIDHPLRRRIWTGGGGEIGIYGPEGETVISAAKLLLPPAFPLSLWRSEYRSQENLSFSRSH